MEPWSIIAEHPATNEPFGLVMQDDCTPTEAEYLARNLLATFRLTGGFLPTSSDHKLHGHYLFIYYPPDTKTWRMTTIWAESFGDAELRLNTLAADGILFMPASN